MKKAWILLLTALMALSFCACQSKAEATVVTTAPAAPAAPAAPTAEKAETPEEAPARKAQVVQTGSGITVMTAEDWAGKYPEIYTSYLANKDNKEVHDYTKDYPMIPIIYEGMAFSKFYGSARGHTYTVEDVTSTGRPHKLANCFTCKTPDYTAMVNEMGDAAYQMTFEEIGRASCRERV